MLGELQICPLRERGAIPWLPLESGHSRRPPPGGEESQICGCHRGVGSKAHPQPPRNTKAIWEASTCFLGHPLRTCLSHKHGGHAGHFQSPSFPTAHPTLRHPKRSGMVEAAAQQARCIKTYHTTPTTRRLRSVLGHQLQVWHGHHDWPKMVCMEARQGRVIQWAEAVSFELLTIGICALSSKGEHVKIHGDNQGVVKGWWKKCSANKPTNCIFCRILELSEKHDRTIHTRYIPSAQNPADAPLRGRYPPLSRRLDPIPIPAEVQPFLIDI